LKHADQTEWRGKHHARSFYRRVLFQKNAGANGLTLIHYPFWHEPYMIEEEYQHFDLLANLPVEGVIGLELVKP
jgi:hypothetical protein